MLTCYIIDDEPHAIKSLRSYIEKTPVLELAGSSENPLEAVRLFEQSGKYADITFLDIDMPQISGTELSMQLKSKTKIVFTTGYANFALEAFELNAYDYLLKPFSYDRFLKCVTKVQEAETKAIPSRKAADFLYIQSEGKGKLVKVFFDDIIFIESQKNYLSVITSEKKYLTYLTLREMEEKLPSGFLRINKSTIINTDKISHVDGNQAYLQNLRQGFTITATYKEAFTIHLEQHLVKTKRSG